LCFIDLDDLKNDYKSTWKEEKSNLEKSASTSDIKIIWFLDRLETECRNVLGREFKDLQVRKEAKKNTQKFINSDLYHRILKPIREREESILIEKD